MTVLINRVKKKVILMFLKEKLSEQNHRNIKPYFKNYFLSPHKQYFTAVIRWLVMFYKK